MKRTYTLEKYTANIKAKGANIVQGCALHDCYDTETIAVFDTLEEAQAELNKYSTYVKYWSSNFSPYPYAYYEVEEYGIAVRQYDDDGEEDWHFGTDYYLTEMPDLTEDEDEDTEEE